MIMRDGRILAAVLALGAWLPLWIARGAQARRPGSRSPHGEMAGDCATCHTPEGWTPLRKPLLFDHRGTGFPLEAAHAQAGCRDCHRSLVFSQVGTACADCHRDAHRGELGAHCERCHTPGVLDEPPGVLPRPQPHALPAAGRACPGRLRGLPRRPAAAAVRGHVHGVRGVPPGRLPGHHRPRPPGRLRLSRAVRRSATPSPPAPGRAAPSAARSRTRRRSRCRARTRPGLRPLPRLGFTGTSRQCVTATARLRRRATPTIGRAGSPRVPAATTTAAGARHLRPRPVRLPADRGARGWTAVLPPGGPSRARPATAWPATATTTTAPRIRTIATQGSRRDARPATTRRWRPASSTTTASSRSPGTTPASPARPAT